VPLGTGIFRRRREDLGNQLDYDVHPAAVNAIQQSGKTNSHERHFAVWRVFCFFFASARRSVFFRRLARLLALSLPLLFPISTKTHPGAPSRHVVVSTKTGTRLEACERHTERNRGRRPRPPE